MRVLRDIIAIAALLVGALWLGQGLGLIRWPANSFMIDRSFWSIMGALLLMIGAFLLWRRRRL